ncbi:hypothetical protein EOM86_13255 [Candidatus Nomurabacteria bacterium]|nr:hypothetical protein [Candidatus Nomurabacteria bacterium]
MKKVLAIIIASMFIFALFSCDDKKTDEESKATSNAVVNSEDSTVSGSDNSNNSGTEKASVELPEGWTKNEDSVLEHHYMKNTASFMMKAESYSSDTIEGITDEAVAIFSSSFDGFTEVGERETIQVGGKDALKMTFTCTISNMEMKYTYVFLFVNDKPYTILFGDLATTFGDLSDDYSYILEHIAF